VVNPESEFQPADQLSCFSSVLSAKSGDSSLKQGVSTSLHTLFKCFFLMALWSNKSQGPLIIEVSRSYTTTQHSQQDSSGWVISSSQRPLLDSTQHSRQTSMPLVGFEPSISASELPHTYTLECAVNGINPFMYLGFHNYSAIYSFHVLSYAGP